MTTETLAPSLFYRDWDANGNPLAGGLVYTYQAGSATPLATYTDSTGGTPNANPVVLNTRGEASIWIPPNTAYKFVVTDSAGNAIRTKDNVVNAQLLSLYGGVDTGVATAYVLNFAAPFTSYADGIAIYWIASNSNTGASTINVNGLGAVSITNQSGSALSANQISAGYVLFILYKSGKFILASPINGSGATVVSGLSVTGTAAIGSTLGVTGATTLTGGFTSSANSTINGELTVNGSASTPPVAVSYAASSGTLNCALSNVFTTTLTGNVTGAYTLSNPQDGQTINWFLTQDATGSRTMTWPTSFKWPSGAAGILTTTAATTDLLVATYRATPGYWYCSLSKAFA